MLFTGDRINGKQAGDMGLILQAVTADRLDNEVDFV